jgi:hypothetical protein
MVSSVLPSCSVEKSELSCLLIIPSQLTKLNQMILIPDIFPLRREALRGE